MLDKITSPRRPRNLLVLFELMAIALLFIYDRENLDKFTIISGISLILLIYVSNFLLPKISTGDNYIFLITTMLLSIGVIMIYRINPALGIKQVIWIGIGILLFFITYFIVKNINEWRNWTNLYFGLSIVLFVATPLFGTTKKVLLIGLKLADLVFNQQK